MNNDQLLIQLLELQNKNIEVTKQNLMIIPKSDINIKAQIYSDELKKLRLQINELSELIKEFGV